jgi:hypothetical protein
MAECQLSALFWQFQPGTDEPISPSPLEHYRREPSELLQPALSFAASQNQNREAFLSRDLLAG